MEGAENQQLNEAQDSDQPNLPKQDVLHHIGPYHLLQQIGVGGMGSVFEAEHTESKKRVAIKTLFAGLGRNATMRSRFHHEIKAIMSLHHPNVVKLIDHGEHEGLLWYAMDLVEGQDFSDWLLKHSGEWDRIAQILAPIAPALQYVHDCGFVHRDIKPGNIRLGTNGKSMLMDFGLVLEESGEERLTQSGMMVGSPPYMSPEQTLGALGKVDARSDIWSLGAVLYHAITGKPPFDGSSTQEILKAINTENLQRPQATRHDIPRQLQAICLKCLQKDPRLRYQSAGAAADDLHRFYRRETVQARLPGPLTRLGNNARNHPVPWVLGTALLVLSFIIVTVAYTDYQRRWGDWNMVLSESFTRAINDRVVIYDRNLSKTISHTTTEGLVNEAPNWVWIEGPDLLGDILLEINLDFPADDDDSIELVLNGKRNPLREWWWTPPGYMAKITSGPLNASSLQRKEEQSGHQWDRNVFNIIESGAQNVTIRMQRRAEQVYVSVNGREVLRMQDIIPLSGREYNGIGLRWFNKNTKINDLRCYRLSLPERSDPLIAGDQLAANGHITEAISQFEIMVQDYGNSQLGERAAAKAYILSAKLAAQQPELSDRLYHAFITDFPQSSLRSRVESARAVDLWQRGDWDAAMDAIEACLSLDEGDDVVLQCLSLERRAIPAHLQQRFLESYSKRGLRNINLSNLGLRSIAGLQSSNAMRIELHNNPITSIAGIQLESCTSLDLEGTLVSDLTPLAGSRVQQLDLGYSAVTSLEGLQGLPLENLKLEATAIQNLQPLAGIALKELNIANTEVTRLDGLAVERLILLQIDHTDIADLQLLRAAENLESLSARNTLITDITVLPTNKLDTLNVSFTPITDISWANTAPLLRSLRITGTNISRIPHLQTPNLTALHAGHLALDSWQFLKRLPLRICDVRFSNLNNAELIPQSVQELYISHSNIISLAALSANNLQALFLGGAQFTDLPSLNNIMTRRLVMTSIPITDLHDINMVNLEHLEINNSKLSDISALIGSKLRFLGIRRAPLSDIQPLRGLHLNALSLIQTAVSDILPLANIQAEYIDLSYNPVRTVDALHGKDYSGLRLSYTQVEDLSPLQGAHIRSLDISGLKNVNLSDLQSIQTLYLHCSFTHFTNRLAHPLLVLRRLRAYGSNLNTAIWPANRPPRELSFNLDDMDKPTATAFKQALEPFLNKPVYDQLDTPRSTATSKPYRMPVEARAEDLAQLAPAGLFVIDSREKLRVANRIRNARSALWVAYSTALPRMPIHRQGGSIGTIGRNGIIQLAATHSLGTPLLP